MRVNFAQEESREKTTHTQGQVSAEGILHLVNPNLGSNSGMRIFETRILEPNSGVEFFSPMFSNNWSAANGGLRDGGLSKSEDI